MVTRPPCLEGKKGLLLSRIILLPRFCQGISARLCSSTVLVCALPQSSSILFTSSSASPSASRDRYWELKLDRTSRQRLLYAERLDLLQPSVVRIVQSNRVLDLAGQVRTTTFREVFTWAVASL